jgi:hypothetical protein
MAAVALLPISMMGLDKAPASESVPNAASGAIIAAMPEPTPRAAMASEISVDPPPEPTPLDGLKRDLES